LSTKKNIRLEAMKLPTVSLLYGVDALDGVVLKIFRAKQPFQFTANPALTPILVVAKCSFVTGFDFTSVT
jgi:hypothetical protein